MGVSCTAPLECKAGDSVSAMPQSGGIGMDGGGCVVAKTQPSCAMFGSKPVFWLAMEDAHTTIPEYKDTKTSFFAVFDGHGGKGTLILLHKEIKKG